jgi:hypothetical protein
VESLTNNEVTYKFARAYFCSGSSTWPDDIGNLAIRYNLGILRSIICDEELGLGNAVPYTIKAVNSLPSGVRADLYKCVGYHGLNVLRLTFCEQEAEDNFKTLIYYVLYLYRCEGKNSESCSLLFSLLEERKGIIEIMRLIGCAPKRKKRQFSITNTIRVSIQFACHPPGGWLKTFLDYRNGNFETDDVYRRAYRPHINWTFIDQVIPPVFCCAARAANRRSH